MTSTIIFYPSWVKLILKIETDSIPLRLSRETGLTYSHTTSIINELEKVKLITKKKTGRTNYINLTKRGLEAKEGLYKASQITKI